MSTRGNYVFIEYPYVKNEDGEWVKDVKSITNLKLGISDDTEVIKRGRKIYVHFDNYPSYALPTLFEFLHLDESKGRNDDVEYLSAWFVVYKAIGLDGTFTKNTAYSGIGLENNLNDWADYTYVILPDINGTFRIFIYDFQLNFVDEIHSDDCLQDLEEEDWWY